MSTCIICKSDKANYEITPTNEGDMVIKVSSCNECNRRVERKLVVANLNHAIGCYKKEAEKSFVVTIMGRDSGDYADFMSFLVDAENMKDVYILDSRGTASNGQPNSQFTYVYHKTLEEPYIPRGIDAYNTEGFWLVAKV